MKIKVDKENWSQASKQSYAYLDESVFYEDIPYLCYKCSGQSTFTAQQQKDLFEIKKAYIWQRRNLCSKCYMNLKALKDKINGYETSWKAETEKNKKNAPFLLDWLSSINELPTYGKPKNSSMAKKLFEIINHR